MDKKSSSSNLIFQTLSADQLENSPVPAYLHIFSNQFIYYKFFNNTGIIQQGQINFCSSIQWPKYFIWEEGSSRSKRFVTSIGNTGNQKYSRLRCLWRVKGLVTCIYLGWSGSILLFRQNTIKVGSMSWLLTCSSKITLSLPSYTGSAFKRELTFCNSYLSLLYFWSYPFIK